MTIESVLRVLQSIGAPYALIGGYAMAARGYPRFTLDVDFLTAETQVLDPEPWTDLVRAGASVDPRRGDADDPLAGVVHIQLSENDEIDVVVGRWKWEAAVIERAEPMTVFGVTRLRTLKIKDVRLSLLPLGRHRASR